MIGVHIPQVTEQDRERLVETLGVAETTPDRTLTLSSVRSAVEVETDSTYASVSETVRDDLADELDADFLEAKLEALGEQIGRIEEVRRRGIPEGEREPERLYRELINPVWDVYDHFLDVGFFESLDRNQPRFTEDHIQGTARELVRAEVLESTLGDVGFDDHERTALVSSVANNTRRLSRWVPTTQIPDGVEFNVEYVPPLYQRAMGGALLWVRSMDVHLWQKSILVTDEILDDGIWDVKALLGGLYLLTRAALELTDERDDLSNSELTAALSASAAITIINQENLCQDAYRITEEMRATSEAR